MNEVATHRVLTVVVCALAIAALGCDENAPTNATGCPDASALQRVYLSGVPAACSPSGMLCPIRYEDQCRRYFGLATCNSGGWQFHMAGPDLCCPDVEPVPGTACEQAPDGYHECEYSTEDAGQFVRQFIYACVSGSWCVVQYYPPEPVDASPPLCP